MIEPLITGSASCKLYDVLAIHRQTGFQKFIIIQGNIPSEISPNFYQNY